FEPDVLAMHPRRVGGKDCEVCGSVGSYFDPLGAGPREGAFVLCDCMKKQCRCEGRAPYKYYDPDSNAIVACPAREAEMAIERNAAVQRACGIPWLYRWRFISFVDTSDQSVLLAVDFAMVTIKRLGQGEVRGLFLHGNTGCGK